MNAHTHSRATEGWQFDPTEHPLWDRQVELEMEIMEQGVDRFRAICRKARVKEQEANLPHVRRLLKQFIEPVTEEIGHFMATQKRKRGVRHTATLYLPLIEPEVAAFLTLKHIMDRASIRQLKAVSLAFSVGKALMAEARLVLWKTQYPEIWEAYERRFERDGATTEHRKKVLRHGFNKLIRDKVEWKDWPEQDLLHVGMKMLELVCKGTKRFELKELRTSATNSAIHVVVNPETAEWLSKAVTRQELMSPVYLPTVMPPKPWTSPTSGAYYTGVVKGVNLVEYRGMTKGMVQEAMKVLNGADMEFVYGSVNMLQETGWSVNQEVLEVADQLWKVGNSVGSLPPRGDLVIPPKPQDIETNEEARKQWRAAAKQAYTQNSALTSKRLTTETILGLARRYREEAAFYYPHYLDFRGRVYPLVPAFQPQGGDLAKGLLQFAEGVAIEDEEGVEWLAIHVANTYGIDKVSYEERVQWVRDNEKQIIQWGLYPLADLGWAKADGGESSFQFLAACKEWAAFRKAGFGYISRLPIRVDGTCNGLQHISALLRDREGGRATNLIPSEKPSDIYRDVADIVTERLKVYGDPSVYDRRAELSRMWLEVTGGSVPRSLTKRSVMILPYGGTMMACRKYIEEWLDTTDPRLEVIRLEDRREALTLVTEVVWRAIQSVVISADVAFRWIKGVAKLAAASGKPLVWTTPSGFPVFHYYAEHQVKQVKVNQEATVIKLKVPSAVNKMQINEQLSGVAPNFVHSLDAAALMLCLVNLRKMGVKSATTIHDSFGTHAGRMGVLGLMIRASFAAMYQQTDPLADFRECCLELVSEEDKEKMPEVPKKGDLEMEEVLTSPYFFA